MLTREGIDALADRILSGDTAKRSREFAQGVRAMQLAVRRSLDDGVEVEQLRHPEIGMRARLRSREARVQVIELKIGHKNAGTVLIVCVRVNWDKGVPARRAAQTYYEMTLTTWRRWVKGARLLPRLEE